MSLRETPFSLNRRTNRWFSQGRLEHRQTAATVLAMGTILEELTRPQKDYCDRLPSATAVTTLGSL